MQSEIVEKLRKVLALTNSPVEGEAQAAAEMLQKLLTQHNLDIADLEMKGHKKAPGIKEDDHDLGKAAFKWKLNLADALAEHYYCVSLTDHTTKVVKFAGRPDNVQSLKMLYAWIIDQIARIAREDRRKHYEETGEHIDPLRWQVNFGLGAVSRLARRLEELKQAQAAKVTETALVVHHLAEVSDYLEEKYGYRTDGRETKRERESRIRWERRDAEWEALLKENPEAAYAQRPWMRPETPEQKAEREKREEKERKKREKAWERSWNRPRRERELSPETIRREEEAQQARAAGRKGADRVNLEPFIEGGKEREKLR